MPSTTTTLPSHFTPRTAALSSNLLQWFARNRRDLPWRHNPTPYRVWISEIMLQQTQAQRVIPYFTNWMQAFPDPRAVAEAPQEAVLKAWEGLGYYSRAQNIQAAAQTICEAHNGRLPGDLPALLALPGIGPYTAAAIASLAFNHPVPAVDANVLRVMARLLDIEIPIRSGPAHRTVRHAVQALIPGGKAGSLNQALMELGALVCLPRRPQCPLCPWSADCRSLARDVVERRPVLPHKKAATSIQVAAGVLLEEGKIFIQKRPPSGLMPNLWEFPGGKLEDGEQPAQALIREFKEELALDIRVLDKITVLKHSYTSFRVTLHVFWCTMARPGQQPVLKAASDSSWAAPEELPHYPFPAADCKLIQILTADNPA